MKSLQDRGPVSAAHDRAEKPSRARRLADLPVGEQFVLWALRQWQCELSAWERDGAFPAGQSGLREGFRIAGLLKALPEFAMAMDAILFAIGPVLEIRRMPCATISQDEAVFIALCGLAQADFNQPLATSLNAMLGAEAAEVVQARLTTFAAMLGAAGLDLGLAQGDVSRGLH